jgi:potassium/hydrogen antiporter
VDTIYILLPALLILTVVASVWLDRWSVPVILVALGAGIIFGSDVLGLWYFGDYKLTNRVANAALVFILFNGGFGTRKDSFRSVALPAGGLAAWGVVLTAAASFGILYGLLRWKAEEALLLSVIISSTDAAATFSILRRQSLPRNLSSTIEIESAANDPMAILMTLAAVEALSAGRSDPGTELLSFAWKFTAGPAIGWIMGRAAIFLFNRLSPQDRGYYYVLFLSFVLATYGLAEAASASGMLAVFAAGFVMGNKGFVHRQGIANFSSALATIANIGMFLLMGLLVFPRQWASLWPKGIALFLVVAFAARPLAVWLGTIGMRIPAKHKVFMSWAGLRGAVPIILATYPLTAGLPIGQEVFNLVFFAVMLSVAIQGSTLGPLARTLGLSTPSRPAPLFNLELQTMASSDLDLIVVDLPDPEGAPGPYVRDLKLPPGAAIALITRGKEVIAPKGGTMLLGWDQVTVLAHAKDEILVRAALLEPFAPPTRDGGRGSS